MAFEKIANLKGPPGEGLRVLGAYDTLEDLEREHPTGAPGDAYLVGDLLYVWDSNTQSWIGAPVRGPQGERGFPGSPATTITTVEPFTVPPFGRTAVVEVEDGQWVIPGQIVYVENALSAGRAGALIVDAVTDNLITVRTPANSDGGDSSGGNGSGQPGLNASFYGEDLINDGNYSVIVNNQFELTEGVAVFVKILSANTIDSPTLNVNGTGARVIRTRAGVPLSIDELNARGFGVLYNGESWLLTTPIARVGRFVNPGTFSVECAGYDSISIDITIALPVPTNPNGVCTLEHLGYGVPVVYQCFNNSTAAARSWGLGCTGPEGVAIPAYWVWSNTINGTSSLIRCDTTNNIANNARVLLLGTLQHGALVLK